MHSLYWGFMIANTCPNIGTMIEFVFTWQFHYVLFFNNTRHLYHSAYCRSLCAKQNNEMKHTQPFVIKKIKISEQYESHFVGVGVAGGANKSM